MKNAVLQTLLSSALLVGLGSCTNYHTRKGNDCYENISYSSAIKHYEKAFRKSNDPEIALKLANSYHKINIMDSAESLYAQAENGGNRSPELYLEYAEVLMQNGKHSEAAKKLQTYIRMNPTDAMAKMHLAACYSISERYRDTTLYVLKPIKEDKFENTFSIIPYKDGAVFVADRTATLGRKKSSYTGNSYLDLYYIQKDTEGEWKEPELLAGDVNGRFHEGPATFSKDGRTVYFTRSNYFKRQMVVNEAQENNLKIFKATLQNGKWENLEEFPFNSDDYSVGHPTLSEDGKTLYFVSDMPGGNGGTDIYKSTLAKIKWLEPEEIEIETSSKKSVKAKPIVETEAWTKPENLGSTINTSGREMFPFLHADGKLYFSSDAHNSLGGLDVFETQNDGIRWSTPENLNYPLNSKNDDFGFSLNEENTAGYVSSSREEKDKIYAFDKFPPTFNLYGIARKKGTQIMMEGVTVEITNPKTGYVTNMVTDSKGQFKLKLNPESNYNLVCVKIGCFSKRENVSTVGLKYSEDFYADFEVEEIVIDKPIVLENIYYDFDKWEIRPDAALELDKLVRLLQDNPTIEIEMGSHTDVRGEDAYNFSLSNKRAESAVQYLIQNGIDASRLTYQGYGEKVLVNECKNDVFCSEEKHQKNRRTEFKVTKIRK